MSINNQFLSNLDQINLGAITDIESEIDSCDMVSLLFLLYEDPQIALQNLTVYLRVSKDIGGSTCNLLQEWVTRAQKRSTWKTELVEALATCQLYTVIRKLGIDSTTAKSLSRKDSDVSNTYIHPMKKIFYTVCENLDSENFKSFKKFIMANKPDIPDHESCEVLFLELICRGYFSPVSTGSKINIDDIEKLLNIIEKISVCKKSQEMQTIYDKLVKAKHSIQVPLELLSNKKEEIQEKKYVHDFNDSFELFNQLSVEELKNDSAVQTPSVSK